MEYIPTSHGGAAKEDSGSGIVMTKMLIPEASRTEVRGIVGTLSSVYPAAIRTSSFR